LVVEGHSYEESVVGEGKRGGETTLVGGREELALTVINGGCHPFLKEGRDIE
jgi:hypothetical protein